MSFKDIATVLIKLLSPGGPSPGDFLLSNENKSLKVQIIKLKLENELLRGKLEINEKLKNLNPDNIDDYIARKISKPRR